MQGRDYFYFNIVLHYVEWKVARVIWIGFYKNNENDACFVDMLPKDLILSVFKFLGATSIRQHEGVKFIKL